MLCTALLNTVHKEGLTLEQAESLLKGRVGESELKGLGLFSEMVAEWSPSLLDVLAPPVSCVKVSAQMGRRRKQPRAFDWKDLVKQK